ncbi:hypothetical protein pb186bvf_000307 [Paramecium bursaria]
MNYNHKREVYLLISKSKIYQVCALDLREQKQLLSRYQNDQSHENYKQNQIYGSQFIYQYHTLSNKFQPIMNQMEIPIITLQHQQNPNLNEEEKFLKVSEWK